MCKSKTLPLSFEHEGVPCQVRQGGVSFCGYVGVPLDSPLAGKSYDDMPLECHGGLTFAEPGRKGYLPEEFFWYGWDYGHHGDYSEYNPEGRLWTLEMVEAEVREVAEQLAKLNAVVL